MRKILTSFLVLMLAGVGLALAKSRVVGSPKATTGESLQTADYGGVDVATCAFSSNFTTATLSGLASGVFHGVQFSSGNIGSYDFVDVFDGSTTLNRTLIGRFYNVNGSSATTISGSNNAAASGFSGPKYPIRFKGGLIFKPNTATYNMIGVLYNQD